jgi:hypothetical protein
MCYYLYIVSLDYIVPDDNYITKYPFVNVQVSRFVCA